MKGGDKSGKAKSDKAKSDKGVSIRRRQGFKGAQQGESGQQGQK